MSEFDPSIVDGVQSQIIIEHTLHALTTATIYDYILTIPGEVAKVWQQGKWSTTTWLFMLNRYLLLLSSILLITPDTSNCTALSILPLIVNYIQTVILAAFSSLRVYALCRQHAHCRTISLIVFALGLSTLPISIYVLLYASFQFVPVQYADWASSCAEYIDLSRRTLISLKIAGKGSLICQEVIVIIIMFYQLWSDVSESNRLLGSRTLIRVMLEGGVIYFSFLLLIDVCGVLVFVMPDAPILNCITQIKFTVQPILISHFLLSLREVSEGPSASRQSQITYSRFRLPTMVQTESSAGNLGEELDHSGADDFLGQDVEGVDTPAEHIASGDPEHQVRDDTNHNQIREEGRV